MSDLLFLVGAGASADAGLPTSNRLTREFLAHLKRLGTPESAAYAYLSGLAQFLATKNSAIRGLRRALRVFTLNYNLLIESAC